MRKVISIISLMLVLLAGAPAYATNCAASTGGGTCCGGQSWYEYSPETLGEGKTTWDCWSVDAGMINVTTDFWGVGGMQVHGFNQHATRTFTVPNDGYNGKWEADLHVDFVDPHSSWWNQIDVRAVVYHPGSGNTTYQVYYRNGTQGNDRGRSAYVLFNAQPGDTLTFDILGSASGDSDSKTQFLDARLFHYAF